jgi:hypothetical protein
MSNYKAGLSAFGSDKILIPQDVYRAVEVDPVGGWVGGFLEPPVRHVTPLGLLGSLENQFFVDRPFRADEVVSRIESFVDMGAKVLWSLAEFLFGVVLRLRGVFAFRGALSESSESKDREKYRDKLGKEMHFVDSDRG